MDKKNAGEEDDDNAVDDEEDDDDDDDVEVESIYGKWNETTSIYYFNWM